MSKVKPSQDGGCCSEGVNKNPSGRETLHQRIPWRRGSGRYVDPRDPLEG
jgi:hypothetical protein